MEINRVIIGTKLNEIQKKPDEVRLVFHNSNSGRSYILTFKGLLFETSSSALNKKVREIQLKDSLGFRALAQLRSLDRNPDNYKQLFIQMEGSTDDNKIELMGAFRNYKFLPKRPSVSKKTGSVKGLHSISKKKAVKK